MKKRSGKMAALLALVLMGATAIAQGQNRGGCRRVDLTGEVSAGNGWQAAIGGGWVLRLVPIAPGKSGFTGWDLAVDRAPALGYPDALLLATPPYLSMNEREIGTTYGLRAQDAIGWNPRSFRFLIDERNFREARQLFSRFSPEWSSGKQTAEGGKAAARLMELSRGAAVGQLQILDARLSEGTGDAVSYARNWAIQAARIPHTALGGASTPRGSLGWIRFRATLWLPALWKAPAGLASSAVSCQP